ncbi:efflux RND transporter periplasmic adaptor subunit [Sulfitobacter sp. D35]|uniref:efflux RND transporter periplasmic adaptor subunit n=1 Tax=Sulfitobacter sp. D35 TaxID=3083252 RepID=UPI00296FC4D3|nr:efflux RND transporter periplasmic adaptor subunit [Sulfitobacter sp. D35]MDW4496652.1 efflux RND transporter periplasmic adaptor subunit [Sulfitobacter sp. D35]
MPKRPNVAIVLLALCAAGPGGAETFDCVMDPPVVVNLGSAISGLLEEVSVARGDVVQAGDVVARVDSGVERAARDVVALRAENMARIEAQTARLKLIDARMQRTQSLRDRGVATEDAMQEIEAERVAASSLLNEARMELELARRELARADALLERYQIRSPIDGIVKERRLAAGEFVHQDTYVVTVVKLDPLFVETFMPVELYGLVRPGDAAIVRPAAPVAGEYPARVEVVDTVFDTASGTFGVRLRLDNPDRTLPAGHRCDVEFSLAATE